VLAIGPLRRFLRRFSECIVTLTFEAGSQMRYFAARKKLPLARTTTPAALRDSNVKRSGAPDVTIEPHFNISTQGPNRIGLWLT